MLDGIHETLLKIGEKREGAFAARVTCGAGDLGIEVKGVGRLRLPVPATQARRLCAIAKPAPFGWKNETRINETVRKTDLPVSHTTLRRGRPYTLVLEKLPALFEREAALRTEQESQLAWLRRRRADFADAPQP